MIDAIQSGFAGAMPTQGLVGGAMIGVAAAIMLLGLGRIAGVSGLAARAVGISRDGAPWPVAAAFVVGLPLGALMTTAILGPIEAHFIPGIGLLLVGGLVVGFGTRLGSGCTSGHGVCGMSRLSRRSLVATVCFMLAGFATVAAMKPLGIGQ